MSTETIAATLDFIAMARFNPREEARAKLPIFEDQSFRFDASDFTPANAVVGYPWLARAEAHPGK